jgi:hypothetical protein
MDVKRFIVELAVSAYNMQYKTKFNYNDFDVYTIPVNPNSRCAFEIYTTRFDDNLRLRLYANFGVISYVGKYTLKEDKDGHPGSGDELFVADAMIDNEFFYLNNNQIRQSGCSMTVDVNRLDILLQENGSPLLLEDNDYILLEEAL